VVYDDVSGNAGDKIGVGSRRADKGNKGAVERSAEKRDWVWVIEIFERQGGESQRS